MNDDGMDIRKKKKRFRILLDNRNSIGSISIAVTIANFRTNVPFEK